MRSWMPRRAELVKITVPEYQAPLHLGTRVRGLVAEVEVEQNIVAMSDGLHGRGRLASPGLFFHVLPLVVLWWALQP